MPGTRQRLHGGTIRFPAIVTNSAGVANAFAGFVLLSTEKLGVVNRIDTMHVPVTADAEVGYHHVCNLWPCVFEQDEFSSQQQPVISSSQRLRRLSTNKSHECP